LQSFVDRPRQSDVFHSLFHYFFNKLSTFFNTSATADLSISFSFAYHGCCHNLRHSSDQVLEPKKAFCNETNTATITVRGPYPDIRHFSAGRNAGSARHASAKNEAKRSLSSLGMLIKKLGEKSGFCNYKSVVAHVIAPYLEDVRV